MSALTVLGIESSCDDTAAAVLRWDGAAKVLASEVSGQTDLQSGDRAVIADDSLFVTDLDTNLTVVAD